MPYLSVITFNDRARLRRISVWSDDILVSESRKVKRRLRRRMRRMPRTLTRRQVEQLYEVLKELENPGRRVKKQHERYMHHVG